MNQENTIKNYLDNLTIKILNPTPQGKKIQFAIAPDYNAIIDKIDTFHYVFEGRFGFKVYNNCGDTATITDGYFKTKFLF